MVGRSYRHLWTAARSTRQAASILKRWLEAKAAEAVRRIFRSVEINSSFDRVFTGRAMRSWLAETPDDFVFTARTSRFITYRKRLTGPELHIPIVFSRIFGLKPKLGPIR